MSLFSSSPRTRNGMSSRSRKSKQIPISPKASEARNDARRGDRYSFSARNGERMTIEGAGSVGFDPNSVRKVVDVQASQAVAWRVFTDKMGAWWPLAYYKIGKANAVDAVIEPQVGGRWFERGEDGST